MEYPALFEPAEEGGFVVTFPDFEWGVTQGDTEREAMEMAGDALLTMIGEQIRRSEDLPEPTRPRGRRYRFVRLPALAGMKAELYIAFRRSGMKKAELARRLGIPKTTVDRLFDFKNRTRVDQMEAAFAALDKQLKIEVADRAA
ncbi:MAG TPA: type II toxin-antitoxin system HicB family antitoxin [Bryobacteraceae bacterium]|nr:type II toxin-antitoxin system HicB family antitoxin [Bryobacteraceae bacterium]